VALFGLVLAMVDAREGPLDGASGVVPRLLLLAFASVGRSQRNPRAVTPADASVDA
jgi:hypothetical protein